MIAVIAMARDEADILELWLRHNLAEGVDHIWLAENLSTDGTREIAEEVAAETGQVTVIDNTDTTFQQVVWMNRLLHMSGEAGADWVIPADIDEFWYAPSGDTLADALSKCDAPKVYARMFRHHSWDACEVALKPLPKVAVRYSPDVRLEIGNHEASCGGGVSDVVELREWQYRGYDHFVSKARLSSATIPPDVRATGGAWHHTRLDGFSDEQMRAEYDAITALPTYVSPIPMRIPRGRCGR